MQTTITQPQPEQSTVFKPPESPIHAAHWQRYTVQKAEEDPIFKNITMPWEGLFLGATAGTALTAPCLNLSRRGTTDWFETAAYISLGAAIGAVIGGVRETVKTIHERIKITPLLVAESMQEKYAHILKLTKQALELISHDLKEDFSELSSTLHSLLDKVEQAERDTICKYTEQVNGAIKTCRNARKANKTESEIKELKDTLINPSMQQLFDHLTTLKSRTEESKEALNEDIIEMKAQIAGATNSSSEV